MTRKGEQLSESEQIKVCPHCAETIKAAAKVCPFCQLPQNRYAIRMPELLLAVFVLLCAGLLAAVWTAMFPGDSEVITRHFARHRTELEVIRTAWEKTPTELGKAIPDIPTNTNVHAFRTSTRYGPGRIAQMAEHRLTGFVTNKGERAWGIQEIEIRFLDSQGKLEDVHRSNITPFVIQPRSEHAFDLLVDVSARTMTTTVHEIRVNLARDANRRLTD